MYACTGAVVEILKRELPFASVVGVDSEGELESSLVDSEAVQPPLTLSATVSGVQVDTEAGCLLGGAGESIWNSMSAFAAEINSYIGMVVCNGLSSLF